MPDDGQQNKQLKSANASYGAMVSTHNRIFVNTSDNTTAVTQSDRNFVNTSDSVRVATQKTYKLWMLVTMKWCQVKQIDIW